MNVKDFEKQMNSIQKKLGKETASLIADDIGALITDNANVNKELEDKEKMINNLKQDKENLIAVNGNLLQQVAVGKEDDSKKDDEDKKPKIINFKSGFDKSGNFIN